MLACSRTRHYHKWANKTPRRDWETCFHLISRSLHVIYMDFSSKIRPNNFRPPTSHAHTDTLPHSYDHKSFNQDETNDNVCVRSWVASRHWRRRYLDVSELVNHTKCAG